MPLRTFTLNSDEAYSALCDPRERPWIPNGALPREPRLRDLEVIVEPSGGKIGPALYSLAPLGERAG